MGIKTKKPEGNYIDQLTWLRGLAALFVIVSHTIRATEVKYSPDDTISYFLPMSLFDMGSFGVVLFFVLSGCTLYISNSDKVHFKALAVFYIKRFFRIWPAFVVSLALYIGFRYIFTAWYTAPQGLWVEKQFLLNYSITDLFSYLSLTFNFTGPGEVFNNAYWSLPVELQYYIIFPIIVATLRFGVIGPLCLGLALYLLPKLGLFTLDDNTVFTLAFSFCGGVAVGYLYKKSLFRINAFVGLSLFIILVCISSAIAQSYIDFPNIPILSSKWNWYGCIAIVTVYVVLITKINVHNKVELFLKHYGTISYSTYLYHNIFVAIAVLLIINFKIYDENTRLFFTFFFTLITSYIAASVSYKYIESPSIVLGRNLIKKFKS